MISYHPGSATAPVGTPFTAGFKTVDTNDPERIARGVSKFAWAPGVFRDGYRSKENFLYADWIGLDFEDEEFSLADAENTFSDMVHVIGTSRNHRVEKGGVTLDRFRVLLLLERRTEDPREFEATMRHLRVKYPIDKKCVDAARHFFACREIISVQIDGYRQELIPPKRTDEQMLAARRAAYTRTGAIPPWTRHKLTTVIPVGERNDTLYRAAKDLMRAGFSPSKTFGLIVDSPTYGGDVAPKIAAQIQALIRSGRKSLEQELIHGGRADPGRQSEEHATGAAQEGG